MNNLRYLTQTLKSRQLPALLLQRNFAQKVNPSSTSSSKTEEESELSNEPVQFFGSQAATWRAKDTRSGGADQFLWYQPYVISASLAVFLLYFCVFREESDIDMKLQGSLFDHVQGLEQVQLTVSYKYNKENGLDNTEIVQRLNELGIDVKELDIKLAEGN